MSSDKFPLTPSLLQHIERRVRFAFSKTEYGIESVTVQIRHLNFNYGTKNKACRVVVLLPGGYSKLVIRVTKEDMYVAINAAISRAAERTMALFEQRRAARHAIVLPFPTRLSWSA